MKPYELIITFYQYLFRSIKFLVELIVKIMCIVTAIFLPLFVYIYLNERSIQRFDKSVIAHRIEKKNYTILGDFERSCISFTATLLLCIVNIFEIIYVLFPIMTKLPTEGIFEYILLIPTSYVLFGFMGIFLYFILELFRLVTAYWNHNK